VGRCSGGRISPDSPAAGAESPLWIVRAWGGDNPDPAAIDWYLLTTQPIESLEEAYQVLDGYCLHWRIERFHYVLKQGLHVERLQFDTLTRLKNALQVYSVIAWHLLYLTHLVREQPQAQAQDHVPAEQLGLLHRATRRKLITLQEVVLSIAGLAGCKASKKQPWPGEKSLWQGLNISPTLAGLATGQQPALWDRIRILERPVIRKKSSPM